MEWFPTLLLLMLCDASARLIGRGSWSPEDAAAAVLDWEGEGDGPGRGSVPSDGPRTRQEGPAAPDEAAMGEELRALRKDPRIIGGSASAKGRYPYAVSLKDRAGHFCGGSLIAKDVVLTAAHCSASSYYVVVGRHALNSFDEGEAISVREQVPHPRYSASRTENDFKLVFLSQAADAEVVRLNSDGGTPGDGDSVTVMGWGDTVASSGLAQISNTLRDVEVKVVSNSRCGQSRGYVGRFYTSYAGKITGNMLCAQDPGQDSCQGDSGGPLVKKGRKRSADVLVGVVSWGIGCANDSFPGVYARISSAYSWIKAEVCKRSSHAPAEFKCPPSSTNGGNGSNDSSPGSSDDDGSCEPFSFDLRTDRHARETSWKFYEIEGGSASLVGSGPSARYADGTYYEGAATGCLPPGRYRFVIYDSEGDGIFKPGYYRLTLNDKVLKLSRDFGSSESTEFTVGTPATEATIEATSSAVSDTLLEEDFKYGYGQFNAGGRDVLHYANILERDGVVRLESGNGMASSIYSDEMSLASGSYSEIEVVFSFYANSMEIFERMCVDYMVDGVRNWKEVQCYASAVNFVNGRWYDDVTLSWQPPDGAGSMRIRFRCDANSEQDDILIDRVKIVGMG